MSPGTKDATQYKNVTLLDGSVTRVPANMSDAEIAYRLAKPFLPVNGVSQIPAWKPARTRAEYEQQQREYARNVGAFVRAGMPNWQPQPPRQATAAPRHVSVLKRLDDAVGATVLSPIAMVLDPKAAAQGMLQTGDRAADELARGTSDGPGYRAALNVPNALSVLSGGDPEAARQEWASGNRASAIAAYGAPFAVGLASSFAHPGALPSAWESASSALESARLRAMDPGGMALKLANIDRASPYAEGWQQSVKRGSPFLDHVQSLEDLKAQSAHQRAQVGFVYDPAVESIGDRGVSGPDGPTTIRELEAQRTEVSQRVRDLERKEQVEVQRTADEGTNPKALKAREQALRDSMAPALAETGIDPHAAWDAMGSLDRINERMDGTVPGKPERTGFSRLLNLNTILNVGKAILSHDAIPALKDEGIQNTAKDLALGRFTRLAPGDVAAKAAFSTPGTRPDLVKFWPGSSTSLPDLFGSYIRQPPATPTWGTSMLRSLPAAAMFPRQNPDEDER